VVELELEQIEKLSDRVPCLGVVSHGRFSVDRVAVPPADALDRDEACLDESATIRWVARSVMPTICAMSRVLTSSSRAIQSRT